MEVKSSEKIKHKVKRVSIDSRDARARRIFLIEEFSGCMLVIPRITRVHENITLYRGRFPEYHL
jgi:hypothetical protein